MLAAAVVTAGVTSLAVLMIMVVTVNIGIVAQISVEQCAHRSISVPADTAVELDARFGQSCLRTAADASANQSVHAVLHQEDCQCAVTAAVGGGSVIDIAKVLIIRDARPIGRIIRGEQPFETDKQLIILPTTCGTGSEVTFGGIITMKDTGLKTAIMDERLSADHAVLVPELVAELPIKFFIHCSVDALGHSMESYVSAARGNEMARAVGARAVQLILNGYRQLIEKGAAYKALLAKDFIQASCLAGMAVNNGGAGPVHALAYPLGEKYKISHGESIYQFLTAVFSIYDQIRPEGALAELKDIVEKPLQEAGFAGEAPVFERLEKMLNQLYPNRPLRETGMTEQDIKPFTESIFASKQRLLVASYVPFTREQAAEIYRRRF